jgi:hypothetical protein
MAGWRISTHDKAYVENPFGHSRTLESTGAGADGGEHKPTHTQGLRRTGKAVESRNRSLHSVNAEDVSSSPAVAPDSMHASLRQLVPTCSCRRFVGIELESTAVVRL